jgi:predicted alpha/beta hydrolase family esterase
MKKRVFIAYCWEGYPEYIWYPWLKKKLEARGFEVSIPYLPKTEEPRINAWVPALAEAVGDPDENTYLVGHSMGCQAIARYLASLTDEVKIGGAVFVAGYFKHLKGLEDDELVHSVVHEWLDTPLNLLEVRKHLKGSVAIFSDDDPYVPLDNQDDFREKLGSKIIIEHSKGHFSKDSNTIELSIALEALLALAK